MTRPLVLLVIGVILAFGILHFSFAAYTKSQIIPGCPAQASQDSPGETVAFWQGEPLTAPNYIISELSEKDRTVLGVSTGDKWIEIDLSDQRLTAHEGGTIFLESKISSGLWNKTPAGEYAIWYKVRSTKMEGGVRGTKSYYYLPNVPYNMFFKGDYGIHGTYWHNNFGRPMSHGCVNSPTVIAEKLFYWSEPQLPEGKNSIRADAAHPGTRVVVHD